MAIVLERQQTTRGFDGKEKTSGEWKFQFFHQTMSDQTLFILRGKKKLLSVKRKTPPDYARAIKYNILYHIYNVRAMGSLYFLHFFYILQSRKHKKILRRASLFRKRG